MVGRVDVDLRDFIDGLNAMVEAGEDLRPVWREIRRTAHADLKAKKTGSDGARWPKYARSTVHRFLHHGERKNLRRRNTYRRGRRKGKLTRTGIARYHNMLGAVKSAYRFELTKTELAAISRMHWTDVHQTGGVAGNRARIPKREFAWFSQIVIDETVSLIKEWIIDAYLKGLKARLG